MAILKILNGMHAGRSFELHRQETTLGRTRECDVVLAAGRVSRRHARILQDPDGYSITDLDSRNGTFVNGERVLGQRRLRDRDRIQLADFVLSFHSETRTVEETPSAVALAAGPAVPVEADQADTPLPTIMSSLDAMAHLRIERNPAEKLRAMLDISSHLGRSLDIDEILEMILDRLFRVFGQADLG